MRSIRFKSSLIGAALCGAGALLYRFPPEQYSFYPRCPVWVLTHWECPGCGATRALAALLHGRVVDAIHYNPLFVFFVPFLLAYFALSYFRIMRDHRLAWPQIPVVGVRYLLFFTAVFTVVRNVSRF
jgi:hypothetical protein